MEYFINIKIKPDAEMRENVLLNKIYTKLHKALFTLESTDIAVSFPNYNVKLGDVIRLHANQDRLAELQSMDWLGGLIGYCEISSMQSVPDSVRHRNISRIQSNMTTSKLKRLIKRGSISQAEIKSYKAKMFQLGLDNPYLELESSSNGHKHRRYLKFGEVSLQPKQGKFDYFGLSKNATVPWF